MGKICTLKTAWVEINQSLSKAVELLAREGKTFQISEDGKTLYITNASGVFEKDPEIIPLLWIYSFLHGVTLKTEYEKEIKITRGNDGTIIADWGLDA